MAEPVLRLFGEFELGGAAAPLGHKAQALLAYLVLAGQPQPRELLATLLWPDLPGQRGLGNLRRELHALRASLGDQVAATRQTIAVHPGEQGWCDVLAFVDGIEQAPADSQQAALALYRAPLLDHFLSEQDGEELAAWLTLWRDRLRSLATAAVQRLVEAAWQRHDLAAVEAETRRWLAFEPLSETAIYQRLLLLERQGEREAALAEFAAFREQLKAAVGLEPASHTRHLAARLTALEDAPVLGLPSLIIGREHELVELLGLLQQKRLVTILGPGGIGKTHLAHHIADTWRTTTGQPAVFVELAGVAPRQPTTASLTAVADSVGLAPAGKTPLLTQLADFLRNKSLLIILDNCEHLVAELAWVEQLGQQAAGLRLLLTSRQRLQSAGESLFTLHGLAVAAGDDTPVNESAAGQLFLLRAQAAQAASQAAGQPGYVNRICRALEGNPLGIALAAAQLHSLSPAAIAAQFDVALDWPGPSDSLPARQQSLRATFEYSWRLLDATNQRVLRYLSLFRGGFSLEAARTVAAADYRSLLALVDSSLMRFDLHRRYDLHEPLRQFLDEKLTPAEKGLARREHGRYYTSLVAKSGHQLRGQEQLAGLHTIRSDYANAQAAWLAAIEQDERELLERMTPGWCNYHLMRGLFQPGAAQFEAALAGSPQAPTGLQGCFYLARGALCSHLDDFTAAQADLQQGLSLLGKGSSTWRAFALNSLGDIGRLQGEYEAAGRFHQQALEVAQAAGDLFEEACAYNGLGSIAHRRAALAEAEAHYRRSYGLHQQLGNHWHTARRIVNLGMNLHRQGNLDQAQQLLEEALRLLEPFEDRDTVCAVLTNLGSIADFAGRYRAAQNYYQQALVVRLEQGAIYPVALLQGNLGVVCLRLGQYEEAISWFEQSLAHSRRLSDRRGIGNQLTNLGIAAFDQGHFTDAGRYFHEGLAIRREIHDHRGVGWSLYHLGELALALREVAAAEAWQQQSLAVRQEVGDEWGGLFSNWGLARVYLARGEVATAERLALLVHDGAEQFNSDLMRTRAWLLLGSVRQVQGRPGEAKQLWQQVIDHPASEQFVRQEACDIPLKKWTQGVKQSDTLD